MLSQKMLFISFLCQCGLLSKALPTTEVGKIEKLLMSTFRRCQSQAKPQLLPV